MSPLLGSRAVDGPVLTREATAGGNLGMEGDTDSVGRNLQKDGGTERRVDWRSDH